MNPDPFAPVGYDIPQLFGHFMLSAISFFFWMLVAMMVIAVGLICWRLYSPGTFEQQVGETARLLRWRLWAHLSWQRLCRRCGLSASEQTTRRDREGRQVTSARWLHPKLLGTDASRTTLRLMSSAMSMGPF